MNINKKNENDLNFIENAAKQLYGFDDATIAREMEEAEREHEQQLLADPQMMQKEAEAMEASFAKLMAEIDKKGLKPVTQEEFEKNQEGEVPDARKVLRLKAFVRLGIIAAAVGVLLIGTTMVVNGNKAYKRSSVGIVKNEVLWTDNPSRTEVGGLEQAYKEIGEELGIKVLALNYKPVGLAFDKLILDKGNARIEFLYGGRTFYLRETSYQANHVSENMVSDNFKQLKQYNLWLDEDIMIIEHLLDDGSCEYIAEINKDDGYYYLSGIMEKEEFIKVVENLNYYQ